MTRKLQLFLLLLSVLTLCLAATPTNFCKCTCFSKGEIVELRPDGDGKPKTCASCNKAFCIDYGFPHCKNADGKPAGEDDITATCFQRDSAKDEAVVFIFIFTTVGLLGWAAIKPWVSKWTEARNRENYIPVSAER